MKLNIRAWNSNRYECTLVLFDRFLIVLNKIGNQLPTKKVTKLGKSLRERYWWSWIWFVFLFKVTYYYGWLFSFYSDVNDGFFQKWIRKYLTHFFLHSLFKQLDVKVLKTWKIIDVHNETVLLLTNYLRWKLWYKNFPSALSAIRLGQESEILQANRTKNYYIENIKVNKLKIIKRKFNR